MSVYRVAANELFAQLAQRIPDAGVLLDVGSGIKPQAHVPAEVHICAEPFDEYVRHLREKLAENEGRRFVVLKATWEEVTRIFPPRSVDTVFLLDVIEHLEKEEGRALLRATEPLARRHVVVFTPLGFLPQSHPDGVDAWGLEGGAQQEHRSGWELGDFDDTWDVYVGEDFHQVDNLGQPLDPPFSAILAIKTTGPLPPPPRRTRRQVLHEVLDRVVDRLDALVTGSP